MADNSGKPRVTWKGVVVTIIVTAIPTAFFYFDLWTKFEDAFLSPPGQNQISFRIERDCASGNLREVLLASFDTNERYRFENGAESLRICADEIVTGTAKELPEKLADRFPGCLRYSDVTHTFSMIANPEAVCTIPAGTGQRYICDASKDGVRDEQPSVVVRASLPSCGSAEGFE